MEISLEHPNPSFFKNTKAHPCSCHLPNQQTELPHGNHRLKTFAYCVGNATRWSCSREGAPKQSDRKIKTSFDRAPPRRQHQGGPGSGRHQRSCENFLVLPLSSERRYQQQRSDGVTDINLRNGRGGHSGRKGIDVEKLTEALVEIPFKNRTTQRAVAKQLGIPQQTLQKNLKKLGMRAASRFLKPFSD